MRQALGFILSLCIHAGLIASALIAFPHTRRLTEELTIVPVELVTLARETNVRAARPEPEKSTMYFEWPLRPQTVCLSFWHFYFVNVFWS